VDPSSCLIDDFGPVPVVRPASLSDLADIVCGAASQKQAIYPLGGRTMLGMGLPPTRPGIGVDMTGLADVIDYPTRDMTITVQAGITIARLQEILRAKHQRLPVDVPRPEHATLGGALATNASGSRRYGFGTLRDYVIGISVVNDEGHAAKAGGRVVKNVAGYDMCKLYIGSLGTLGIIQQVTLKLRPLPESEAVIVTGCAADTLEGFLSRLHESRTRPVCIDVVTPTPLKADFQVVIGFEGNLKTVEWEVARLQKEFPPGQPLLVRTGADARRDFSLLAEGSGSSSPTLHLKANLVPSAVAGFLRVATPLSASPPAALHAHAGNGIVHIACGSDLTLEQAKPMLTRMLDAAVAAQGNVVVTRCAPAWKASLPVWGRPRGDLWLMKAVKERLDPGDRFNPGRFLV